MLLIFTASALPRNSLGFMRRLYATPHHAVRLFTGARPPRHGVVAWIDRQCYANIFDKPLHALEFAVLTWLWWRACSQARTDHVRRSAIILAAALALATAVTDEWRQAFTPGREMRLTDLLADAVGIAAIGLWSSAVRTRQQTPTEAV